MALNLVNLDTRTRGLMIQEIDRDISANALYIGKTLSPQGVEVYPSLLKEAAEKYDDSWLTQQLVGKFNAKHEYLRQGKLVVADVPKNAPEMLATGEFNRFYLRGLCLRAIEDNIQSLVIYRAKPVEKARPESEAKIGTSVSPTALLNDLRANIGVDTALGLPAGPNSGLSAKLP